MKKDQNVTQVDILQTPFEIIKEKLENSSRANKNFAFLLISFTTYLLITTLSIKDVQLLFPELGIQLPILNITLPLNAYMIVAPLLLTALYINMLLNIYEHIKLIEYYKELSKNEPHQKALIKPILPFMIDYSYLNPDKSSYAFRVIFYFMLFIFPLMVLFIIFIRFADYQNLYFSGFQVFLLVISIVCLFQLLRALYIRGLATLKVFISPTLIFLFTLVMFLISLTNPGKFNISIKPNEKLPLPNISHYKEYLENIKYLIKKDLNITFKQKSIPSLDLNGRNLIGATLEGIFFPLDNLKSANLTYSNLSYGSFISSNFSYSVFDNTNLDYANLENSVLSFAKIVNSKIIYANFQNADLYGATIKNSYIMHSSFNKAKLFNSKFYNNIIEEVSFQDTTLDASFYNSILYKVNLLNIQNYDKNFFINTLIIEPIIEKKDIEKQQFFSNSKFKDFNKWFMAIKKENLTKNDIQNFIFVMKKIYITSHYKKEAQETIKKLQKLLKTK